jgi:hypothetical protein
LAWHVERHRVLFPRVYLSNAEIILQSNYRHDCFNSAWTKKLAEIQARFKLINNDEMDSLDYVGDGYIVHMSRWFNKPDYIRAPPHFYPAIFDQDRNCGPKEFVTCCNQAQRDTRDLRIAIDTAWRKCGDGK